MIGSLALWRYLVASLWGCQVWQVPLALMDRRCCRDSTYCVCVLRIFAVLAPRQLCSIYQKEERIFRIAEVGFHRSMEWESFSGVRSMPVGLRSWHAKTLDSNRDFWCRFL